MWENVSQRVTLPLLLIIKEIGACFRIQLQILVMKKKKTEQVCFPCVGTHRSITSFPILRMGGVTWFFQVTQEIVTVNYADEPLMRKNAEPACPSHLSNCQAVLLFPSLLLFSPPLPFRLSCLLVRPSRGAVASWLVPFTPDQGVQVPALVGNLFRVVFLGKTLYSHSASIHPGV